MSRPSPRELVVRAAGVLAAQGWVQADIATALGYKGAAVISQWGVKRQKKADARLPDMIALYESGKTLTEIGVQYRITRERVRQILNAAGVQMSSGGRAVRKLSKVATKERARIEKRNGRAMKFLGCDWETAFRLNGSGNFRTVGTRAYAYLQQMRSAEVRNIEWRMTFPEWCRIWDESGRWAQRGRGKQGYCMSRKGDIGPYSADNVRIISNIENIKESYDVTPVQRRMAERLRRREELQRRCRDLRAQGVSHKEIGRILGISAATSLQYACAAKEIGAHG